MTYVLGRQDQAREIRLTGFFFGAKRRFGVLVVSRAKSLATGFPGRLGIKIEHFQPIGSA